MREQEDIHAAGRMNRVVIPAVIALLAALVLIGAGLSESTAKPGSAVVAPSALRTQSTPWLAAVLDTETPDPFSRSDPGGVVVGVVFDHPLTLNEALAFGPGLGGDPIAVFRTDYACVRPITWGGPDWVPEPSRFAYVEAERIRERRIAAVNAGLSPPISGWSIAESYWLHWEDQWRKAQKTGVLVEALAVYVPEDSVDGLADDERFRSVEIVPHRRTDSLDPDFLGELLLDSEDFPPGVLSQPDAPTCPASTFTDVRGSHPYRTAIEGLFDLGVVGGYGNGLFGPSDTVKRAQFAKMVVGALGLDVYEGMSSPFTDLGSNPAGDLYPHDYIAAAFANGITNGITADTFGPYLAITRAQAVTMIVRAVGIDELSSPPEGFDGSLGDFSPAHAPSMRIAEYNGLLNGLQGPTRDWDPWSAASRGECAQILWNVMTR